MVQYWCSVSWLGYMLWVGDSAHTSLSCYVLLIQTTLLDSFLNSNKVEEAHKLCQRWALTTTPTVQVLRCTYPRHWAALATVESVAWTQVANSIYKILIKESTQKSNKMTCNTYGTGSTQQTTRDWTATTPHLMVGFKIMCCQFRMS